VLKFLLESHGPQVGLKIKYITNIFINNGYHLDVTFRQINLKLKNFLIRINF